jgi:hypothetical protein
MKLDFESLYGNALNFQIKAYFNDTATKQYLQLN